MAFAIGDRVRLERLEDWFFDGMSVHEVHDLKALVGQIWIVEGLREESGTYELVYEHPSGSTSPLEWISVPPDWILRTD